MYPIYGDDSRAWTPKSQNQQEYLELFFKVPVFLTKIEIYETFNPGAVVKISVKNSSQKNKSWVTVYQGSQQTAHNSRIFTPTLDLKVYMENDKTFL